MNKRQAKKKYKKALDIAKTSRKTGIEVSIIHHIFVDKNGKPCDVMEKGSRHIINGQAENPARHCRAWDECRW